MNQGYGTNMNAGGMMGNPGMGAGMNQGMNTNMNGGGFGTSMPSSGMNNNMAGGNNWDNGFGGA